MTPRTDGPFRVLPGRSDDEWLLLDVESADPTYVPREALGDVSVGNRVAADLTWHGDEPGADVPSVESPTVETETVFRFVRTDEPIFEAARNCFETARAEGEAMNSRVTYNTDNEANGVVYTFAEQAGRQDLYAEFRDGGKPLEPLVDRAIRHEDVDPPVSVWILDSEEPFLVVYIVLDPQGLLEETMQDTYL